MLQKHRAKRRGRLTGSFLAPSVAALAVAALAPGADAQSSRTREDRSSAYGRSLGAAGEKPAGLTFDEEGITFRSDDGRLETNLGGRLHLDAGGGEGRGPLAEQSLWRGRVRRAWAEFLLTYDRAWTLSAQVDAASRQSPIQDLALGYSGLGPFIFTIGNFTQPFSLENLESSNAFPFMERSLANALSTGRGTGFAIGANEGRWTAVAGVFGADINEGAHNNGVAVTARVTYAPLLDKQESKIFHLGVAASVRAADRSADFSIRPTPESNVYDTPIIGFDAVRGVRSLARFGFEAAFQNGPLLLQGQYILARADRDAAPEEWRRATFHGGYVQAAYMVTGQARSYELAPRYGATYAVFGGVDLAEKDRVSRGGFGAWEIAARYSVLNLDKGQLRGGVEHNATIGLNWYPDTNVRVLANYIRAFGDNVNGTNRRAGVDIVQVRLQIAY
jgi:phosphate-selective porin OprO/OprP